MRDRDGRAMWIHRNINPRAELPGQSLDDARAQARLLPICRAVSGLPIPLSRTVSLQPGSTTS